MRGKRPVVDIPEAGNQKELEQRIRVMMGPPPQETAAPEKEALGQKSVEVVMPDIEALAAKVTGPEEPEEKLLIIPESHEQPVPLLNDEVATDEDMPEDTTTAKAVDEIVAEEGETVLKAEDAEVAAAFVPEKTGFKAKIKRFFRRWWDNPKARWATIIILTLGLLAAIGLPASRYFLLNSVGVRASAALSVIDASSQQPLKNVRVSLGGQTAVSDSEGKVRLNHLRLGRGELSIEKRAYAGQIKQLVVGWGSNPLEAASLTPTGSQYTILITDFLSGKPVEKVEATAGEANALSDKDGKLVLSVDAGDDEDLTVTLTAPSYRDEKITFSLDAKTDQVLKLVPARKHAFISKRSGKFDLYKIDADGQHEELVLAGTGNEQDNISLLSSPTSDVTALVSTRDAARNSEGFLLSTLTLVNLADNTAKTVVQSERLQVLGWTGNRLIFVQIAAGASAANPKRYRLMAYDYTAGTKAELAADNYFTDARLIGTAVYYALPSIAPGLYKIGADGANKQAILSSNEVWNVYRSSYEMLSLSVGQDWYEYRVGTSKPTKLSGQPASLSNRVYTDNPDSSRSVWVDNRDGKGVLVVYDVGARTENVLVSSQGVGNPLHWLSNTTFIYRKHTDQETADYVVNIDGGDPKKINDVTNTTGLSDGYFY